MVCPSTKIIQQISKLDSSVVIKIPPLRTGFLLVIAQRKSNLKKIWLIVTCIVLFWLSIGVLVGPEMQSGGQLLLLILLSLPLGAIVVVFGSGIGKLLLSLGLESSPHVLDLILGLTLFVVGYVQWFYVYPKLSNYGKSLARSVCSFLIAASFVSLSLHFKCGDLISMCSDLSGHLLKVGALVFSVVGCVFLGFHFKRK